MVERNGKTRLAEECEKLDKEFERELAEEILMDEANFLLGDSLCLRKLR